MYLKVYYPLEFYTSLVSTAHNEEKIGKVLKEFKREGGTLLGADINKSKTNFSIDKDGIRIGFSNIKGIGQKAAEIIEQNQPYQSFNDFEQKLKGKRITSSTKQKLVNLGAFENYKNESGQPNLFGEIKGGIEKKTLTFSEIFSICPYLADIKIFDTWKSFINKNIKHEIVRIEHLKDLGSQDAVIIGFVYDKNLRDKIEVSASKGKKIEVKEGESTAFCNFTVEDDSDFVTVRLSTRVFPQYGKLIFEDLQDGDIVIIKGRMGSGIRMFFGNKIAILNKIKEKSSQIKDFRQMKNTLLINKREV